MRRAFRRLTAAVTGLLVGASVLGAWQWPVSEFSIVAGFGEPRSGGVSPGVLLVSESGQIMPAEEGEVVFSLRGDGGSSVIPSGLGNFLVLEHEGGFRSLYAHLDESAAPEQRRLTARQPLGTVGETGFSPGNALRFRVIDVKRSAYVNPMVLLPELEDEAAPRIEDVVLSRAGRRIWPTGGAPVGTGSAALSARIYDPPARGPYRGDAPAHSMMVFLNGQETFSLALETLSMQAGRLVISPDHPTDELYGANLRVRLGTVELSPGENLLEIIARDVAGNEQITTLSIVAESE
jgi:hypothetical protein